MTTFLREAPESLLLRVSVVLPFFLRVKNTYLLSCWLDFRPAAKPSRKMNPRCCPARWANQPAKQAVDSFIVGCRLSRFNRHPRDAHPGDRGARLLRCLLRRQRGVPVSTDEPHAVYLGGRFRDQIEQRRHHHFGP